MTKALPPDKQASQLFKQAVAGVTALAQDKIPLAPPRSKGKADIVQKNLQHSQVPKRPAFEFSDQYQAAMPMRGPLQWSRSSESKSALKRLRRGEYLPEQILDLHGHNRRDAKSEIAALLHYAEKHHLECVCIIHGIGSRILKQAIPSWLVQHPLVLGFHSAPREYGGDGALLVLLDCAIATN